MNSPATPSALALADRDESLRRLPPAARAAFARFQSDGDPAALHPVVLATLEHFIPRTPAHPLAGLPGDTLLIDQLGFDSLAITEVVFFTENLFGITISNQEIARVRTLDDLSGFIRQKVAAVPLH